MYNWIVSILASLKKKRNPLELNVQFKKNTMILFFYVRSFSCNETTKADGAVKTAGFI